MEGFEDSSEDELLKHTDDDISSMLLRVQHADCVLEVDLLNLFDVFWAIFRQNSI